MFLKKFSCILFPDYTCTRQAKAEQTLELLSIKRAREPQLDQIFYFGSSFVMALSSTGVVMQIDYKKNSRKIHTNFPTFVFFGFAVKLCVPFFFSKFLRNFFV